MTISTTHTFVSAKSDGPDATLIRASNWNETHVQTMATAKILGRTTAGTGAVEELDIADYQGLEAGTLALFQQTAAPTGWTKETTHNDKAFRVVTGTASSGGTDAFSTVFALTATDAYTLLEADIPAHTHVVTDPGHTHSYTYRGTVHQGNGGSQVDITSGSTGGTTGSKVTGISNASTGGDGSHAHNIDLRTQYVDIIIAAKD